MNKLQLAMNAGARAIEENKRLDGKIYAYDIFSNHPEEIFYHEASKILREQQLTDMWIPVDEQLPKINESVLVTYNNKEIAIDFIQNDEEWFWEDREEGVEVVAWQPLPEPYKSN